MTKKRNEIVEILKKSSKPLSSEEIFNILSSTININLSTIYRTLNRLVSQNIVTKYLRQDKITYFEYNDNTHKHHLVCNNCFEVISINSCPIDKLEKEIITKTGYKIIDHTLEFRGLCPKCMKK